jgi:methyl-accepting chemotaxis protein
MTASSSDLSTLAKSMEEGAKASFERINNVAAAAEEMSATISSIAENTEQATLITRTAVEQASGTTGNSC